MLITKDQTPPNIQNHVSNHLIQHHGLKILQDQLVFLLVSWP